LLDPKAIGTNWFRSFTPFQLGVLTIWLDFPLSSGNARPSKWHAHLIKRRFCPRVRTKVYFRSNSFDHRVLSPSTARADRCADLGYEDVAFEIFVHQRQESRLGISDEYTVNTSLTRVYSRLYLSFFQTHALSREVSTIVAPTDIIVHCIPPPLPTYLGSVI
jgi:hypothetical protein